MQCDVIKIGSLVRNKVCVSSEDVQKSEILAVLNFWIILCWFICM